jgi:intracellular multiplication protein IcmO
MNYVQRGLDKYQEQDYRRLIRDVRTLGQKTADFYKIPENVTLLVVSSAIACFFLPAGNDIFFLFGIVSAIVLFSHRAILPFRLPKRSKKKDYNSPAPGGNKPTPAAGIYYVGNDRKTNEELWFTNEDMRTHMLIFGSTGSGKTEALVSIAFNALIQSSGFIYVDGKGDNSLFSKIFSMVRYMGREDDLLLINFMTGARDIIGPQKRRLSNTMNPFALGSSSMLAQLVISLMEAAAEGSPSADMWKGRAMAFVEALMKVLVAMRDAEYILLDANVIRNYFTLERLEAMVLDKVFIRDNQESVSLEGFPPVVMEPISNYVLNLPGYQKDKKGKQVSQVYEQHGYITMQLTRVFTSLADTYGHILRHRLAEVDLKDVVLNRRILTVLLPALEKSPEELANLGKVIIASLRVIMAAGLGEEVEGKYAELVKRKPTNAKTPFLCILDEYGYYAVKGFAIVPAQARSLGFSVVFAGQDLPALQKASKEEAATIGANTNIKLCMKLEDPLETWDFFMKTAGESYVSHVSGFQTDTKSITSQYLDTKSAQMEKRARVDLLDLKEQREGEAHIFFKSRIVRAKMFYANPDPVTKMRLNHMLKVDAPADSVLRAIVGTFDKFEKIIKENVYFENAHVTEDEKLDSILASINAQKDAQLIEASLNALIEYNEKQLKAAEVMEETVLSESELNIFTGLRLNEKLKSIIVAKDLEAFGRAILDKKGLHEGLSYIEKLAGRSDQYSKNVTKELIKDMVVGTYYPPKIENPATGIELSTTLKDVINSISPPAESQET